MRRYVFKVIRINRSLLIIIPLVVGLSLYMFNQLNLSLEQNAVEALSWSAANRVIAIDPGHGGLDPGAVGLAGTQEKEVALAISKKLAQLFAQAGAVVLLTRQNDRDLTGLNEGSLLDWDRYEIAERVDMANKKKADIFVGIHCNAIAYTDCRGAQTFYHPPSKESKRLAKLIQNEIIAQLNNTEYEPHPADYYTLRKTKMPSVTVEVGFLSNPDEEMLLRDGSYQLKMARAIYGGVLKYLAETPPANRSKPIPKPDPKPKRWWEIPFKRG